MESIGRIVGLGALVLALNSCYNENSNKEDYWKFHPPYYNFPTEKILTISVEEYISNQKKELNDYEMIGVNGTFDPVIWRGFNEIWWGNIPKETEVIVNVNIGSNAIVGTALIPKGKKESKKKLK